MQSNPILKAAIENGNVLSAQAVILASFRKARNEKTYQFIEWADYAKDKFNEKNMSFFVEDDGNTEFTDNVESWNEDLWKNLRVEVEYNFSQLKLNYIISVMNHLRKIGHPDFQVKAPSAQQSQVKKVTTPESTQLKTGAIAGAAVGFAIGLMIGRPIIGSVVGAAVGGGIGNSISGSKAKE